MIIDAISDLHGTYPELEGGDLLIIAGDMTACHTVPEFFAFYSWLHKQKYRKKIYIGGNHDPMLAQTISTQESKEMGVWEGQEDEEYLRDNGTEFEGLKIWGAPWSLTFPQIHPKCKSFTGTEKELEEKYDLIPTGIDILISHTPMWRVLDSVEKEPGVFEPCGSYSLRQVVDRVKPKYLISGHIHEGFGYVMYKHLGPNTHCYNVSILNERYEHVNPVTRIEI